MKKMVIKRDGRRVDFDISRIEMAIRGAISDCINEGKITNKMEIIELKNQAFRIAGDLFSRYDGDVSVEELQDAVEEELSEVDYRVARAYAIYRTKRTEIRDKKNLDRIQREIIDNYSTRNSNANVDENTFSGKELRILEEVIEQMGLNLLPPYLSKKHNEREIYIHDLTKFALGQHNCFSREEKFITNHGTKSFKDFNDGDCVVVLTHDGTWKKATVHKYGVQQLNKITFTAGRSKKVVRATGNHTWLLKDGSRTTELKVGDELYITPQLYKRDDYYNYTKEQKMLWCQGFVLGDGTQLYKYNKKDKKCEKDDKCRVRLCGAKKQFLDRFIECGFKQYNTNFENGDIEVVFNKNLKYIPNIDIMSLDNKMALFNGLYEADGVKTGGYYGIQSSHADIIDMIKKYAEATGLYISRQRDLTGEKTKYTGVNGRPYTIDFGFRPYQKFSWRVQSIESDKIEEVWCLEVEENHSFVLSGGMVTGNCLNMNYIKLLKNGFRIGQGDVKPAKHFGSFIQLLAVVIQLQSLQQFGGVGLGYVDTVASEYVQILIADVVREMFYFFEIDNIEIPKKLTLKELHDMYYDHMDDTQERLIIEKVKKAMHQGCQALITNLVTLQSRSGGQLPFSSLNIGYDTTDEGLLFSRILLEEMDRGIGRKDKTAIFPIICFNVKEGINKHEGDKGFDNYQYAIEVSCRRHYPTFTNGDWNMIPQSDNPLKQHLRMG